MVVVEYLIIKITNKMSTKSIVAIAVVNKKSPKLDIREIYSIKDSKELVLGKDEKIIKIIIKKI